MIIGNQKIQSIHICDQKTKEFLCSINDFGIQWKKTKEIDSYPPLEISLFFENEEISPKATGPETLMYDEELLSSKNPKELLHQWQWNWPKQ